MVFGRCLLPAFALTLWALPACEAKGEPARSTTRHDASSEAASGHVEIVKVLPSTTDLRTRVQAEVERAKRDGRDVVVYVGASWCEPCQRFHDAAAAGQLDTTFPTLRLLELDLDTQAEAINEAECASRLIPLFARPTADGRCSEHRVEGGIKGDGAVAFMVPRLRAMLEESR